MLKINKFLVLVFFVVFLVSCGTQSLQLVKFDLAKSIKGMGDYEPAGKTSFQSGETIFLYTQVKGITTQEDNGKMYVWPITTVKVRNSQGKLIMSQDVQKDMVEVAQKTDEIIAPAEITLTGNVGAYRVEVVVEDGFTGERIFNETGITLEK